jgi:hypothetical protein
MAYPLNIHGVARQGGQQSAEVVLQVFIGGVIDLSGSIHGAATLGGQPQTTATIQGGMITGSAALAGAVAAGTLIQGGAVAGQASLGGELDLTRQLAGAVAGTTALAGQPEVHVYIPGGTIPGASTLASGPLSQSQALAGGVIIGASELSGSISSSSGLAGTISGRSILSGPIGIEGWNYFEGQISGQARLGGTLLVVTAPLAIVHIIGKVLQPDGLPAASGSLVYKLSEPATLVIGAESDRIGGRGYASIDGLGNVSFDIVANDVLTPSGTYYTVRLTSRRTNRRPFVWTEKWSVASSTGPVDVGEITRL